MRPALAIASILLGFVSRNVARIRVAILPLIVTSASSLVRSAATPTDPPAPRLSNGLALLNFALMSGFVRWAYLRVLPFGKAPPEPRAGGECGLHGSA